MSWPGASGARYGLRNQAGLSPMLAPGPAGPACGILGW